MLLKRSTIIFLLVATVVSIGSLKSFGTALNSQDSQVVVNETNQEPVPITDTVYLNQESDVRYVLEVERNTRGLKENVKYYSTLVVIGLVVIGAIGFLIFRKGKTE